MRKVLALTIVLAFLHVNAHATNIWLSTVGAVGGGVTIEAPAVEVMDSGELFIWARPDEGQTLLNISLNLRTTTQGAIDLTGVSVLNPVVGASTALGKDYVRYEYRLDSDAELPYWVAPKSNPSRLDGFGGYSVFGLDVIGVGFGPNTVATDPWFDAAANAWLVGSVSYDVTGAPGATTELFLQIGAQGITDTNLNSPTVNIVFGNSSDPPLNAEANRGVNSATADATIMVVIPEPSAVVLAVLGMLGLAAHGLGRRR